LEATIFRLNAPLATFMRSIRGNGFGSCACPSTGRAWAP